VIIMKNEIVSYQFAERIKSALIISSKMLLVLEGLREDEFEGAKKVTLAFFDALSTETALAVNATGLQDFRVAEEKIKLVKRMIEGGNLREAHATLGSTVTNATTACASAMKALTEKGLL
jgi:hypothetical protein